MVSDWLPRRTCFKKPILNLFYICSLFVLLLWLPSIHKLMVQVSLKLPHLSTYDRPSSNEDPDYLMKTEGCKIYRMDPFGPDVKGYLRKAKAKICQPSLVYMDNEVLRFNTSDPDWEGAVCCYNEVYRKEQTLEKYGMGADRKVIYKKPCKPMNKSMIMSPLPSEVLRVHCTIQINKTLKIKKKYHFVKPFPLKTHSNKTAKKEQYWNTVRQSSSPLPPSVIIIGIDSVSRNHFLRSMPETHKFLMENDFVDMRGYTKIGRNTFPNAMAFLGGMYADSKKWPCWLPEKNPMDGCPLIWKDFENSNYVTAFMEDAPGMAIFNYFKIGFVQQPTDYYSRTMAISYGNPYYGGSYGKCISGKTETEVLWEYTRDVLRVVKDAPLFLFAWFTSLAHDDFNLLKHSESKFRDLLAESLQIPTGSTHDPVVIFMSDHGSTVGYFRSTILGYYEDALPFLFMRIPPSLKAKLPNWNENLNVNSRRLITPFDLHSTLVDIAHLSSSSQASPRKHLPSWSFSFFEKIPSNRTCESARIPREYCRCGVNPKMSHKSKLSKLFMKKVVVTINSYMVQEIKRNVCVPLKANSAVYLREIGQGEVWNNMGKLVPYTDFVLGMTVKISGGMFEAVVRHVNNKNVAVVGEVSRTNRYAGQSDCVNDSRMKNYCLCWDFYEKVMARQRERKRRKAERLRRKRLQKLRLKKLNSTHGDGS